MKLFIGLMSGTSMDGIDAALIDLESNTFIHGITYPYSVSLAKQIKAASTTEKNTLGYYSQLNTLIGREFAQAVLNLLKASNYSPADIVAIGSHGQTLGHDATAAIPYTVQLGCAHTIAELTGIAVVADFRTRDLIVGGQGAPFAPIYHQALFQNQKLPLAVVNIGGIANLSYLHNKNDVFGYDIGPGNCLMDAWISYQLSQPYDKNGDWARAGKEVTHLLEKLLRDDYFQRPTPKSIGKEYFSLSWLNKYLNQENIAAVDVQATLNKLTAVTIARGIKQLPIYPSYAVICGGGVHNQVLMEALQLLLPEIQVVSTKAFNVDPDFLEALMFAWLAEKRLTNTSLNLSYITGAKHPAILGAIYPAGIDKRNCHKV